MSASARRIALVAELVAVAVSADATDPTAWYRAVRPGNTYSPRLGLVHLQGNE